MTQAVATTIVLASLYALLGVGYVLIYRASRVLNLAQGDMMTLGGYALPEYGYPYGFPATPAYGYPYGFPVEPSYPPLYGAPSAPLPVFSRYPAIRSNPQTGRRRSGSYFGSGPATNPQTLRRRGQFGAPR